MSPFRPSSLLLAAAALCREGSLVGAMRKVVSDERVASGSEPFELAEGVSIDGFTSTGICKFTEAVSVWKETSDVYTIQVKPSTTTVEFESGSPLKAMLKEEADNFIGTHATEDFKKTLCTDPLKELFPNACDFFKSKSLALQCSHLAVAIKALKVGGKVGEKAREVGGLAAGKAREGGEAAAGKAREGVEYAKDSYEHLTLAFSDEALSWKCGGSSWKQQIPGMEVRVRAASTEVTGGGDGIPEDFIGKFTTTEFKKKVCSAKINAIFPHACDFFTQGGLAAACPNVYGLIYAQETKQNLKNWINESPPGFTPAGALASGDLKGLAVKDNKVFGSCGLKKWSQTFVIGGNHVFKINVGATGSSVDVEPKYADAVNSALPGFAGEYEYGAFKKKVCEDSAIKASFPYACDFLKVKNGLKLHCTTVAVLIKGMALKNGVMGLFG